MSYSDSNMGAVFHSDGNEIPETETSVAEVEEERSVKARQTSSNSTHRYRCLSIYTAAIVFIITGVVVGLSVGLTARRNNSNNNNSSSSAAQNDKVMDATKKGNESTIHHDSGTSHLTSSGKPTSPTKAPGFIFTGSSYYPSSVSSSQDEAGSMYQDDGTCSSPANNSSTVIIFADIDDFESSACAYVKNQSVYVLAPAIQPNVTTAFDKKLSGGNSAFDSNNSVIVSYNSDGTAGAIWILSYNINNSQQGMWEQTGILQTSYEDQLGWSVAITGDTVVVGAPGFQGRQVPLQSDGWYWSGRGNAIVMTKNDSDGDWAQQDILVPKVAEDAAGFGNSVDIAECECLIAVGAWHDRDSRGSVYVFEKYSNGTWVEIQKLAFNDTRRSQSGTLHGNYGYNVALSNEYLAVKAPYDSYLGSYEYEDVNRGVTYVYKRGPDGLYEQISRLCTPEGKQVGGFFKDMIFLNDFLLVGAPGKNTVYVFKQHQDPSFGFTKTAEFKLNTDELDNESSFGIRLDGRGTHVMVGDLGGKMSYIFSFEDGVWRSLSYTTSVDTASSGTSIVTFFPESFEVDDEQYGGEVNFDQLVCEL